MNNKKNQPAEKVNNSLLKQTYDINIAESLSPITKKLDEVKESTQKIGDVIKAHNTPQIAIEKTRNALPIGNEKTHPGVIYDTSLEITLSDMKDKFVFLQNRRKRKWWYYSEGTSSWKNGW